MGLAMRHQVPFIGEAKIVRADDDLARAKRTSGKVIDDVVGEGVAESSWDDVVKPGWLDKSKPKKSATKDIHASVSVPKPNPNAPLTGGGKSLVSTGFAQPKVAAKTKRGYSGTVTFADSASLDWTSINNGRGLRINIYGCIDHDLRKEWSRLLSDTEANGIHEFEFNLTETPALSLTGLGMLLLFKERKKSTRDDIKLCNCNKEVVQLLHWTGMEKYFHIEAAQIANEKTE